MKPLAGLSETPDVPQRSSLRGYSADLLRPRFENR
jgi:hypothetical protein